MNESVATPGMTTMKTQLRRILSESARLDVSVDSLGDSDDLYAAGLSSLATVHVMLAIEDEFAIEIPDRMLTRRLFLQHRHARSIDRRTAPPAGRGMNARTECFHTPARTQPCNSRQRVTKSRCSPPPVA